MKWSLAAEKVPLCVPAAELIPKGYVRRPVR